MFKISNETKIGLLAIVAIALGIWGFKFLKGMNVLTASQTFYIRYDNVEQLRPSSPVFINGLQVGMVKDIFVDPEDDQTIVTVINLERRIDIPKNTVAVIVSESIMGGKAIDLEINGTCEGGDCAQSGDYLTGRTKSFFESVIGNPKELDAYTERLRIGLTALYDSIAWWTQNPTEGNQIIAEGMGMSIEDVEMVLGKDGSRIDGGLYVYNFMDAAQFCGVAPGDPPFGQTNGQMADHWNLVSEWWVKFGLIKEVTAPENGVECSLHKELYDAGYRG